MITFIFALLFFVAGAVIWHLGRTRRLEQLDDHYAAMDQHDQAMAAHGEAVQAERQQQAEFSRQGRYYQTRIGDPPKPSVFEGLMPWMYRTVAGGAALIGLVLLLLCTLATVGTQNIGVETAYGHVDGYMTSGLHFKAPWDTVTQLDARAQTDTYASNGFDGSNQVGAQDGCVNVRIARQATACVNVTIRWQLDPQGVDYLFKTYKTNDNIRDNLLHRDLQSAVNVAFSGYDPLGLDKNGLSTQPTTTELAQRVQTELNTEVGQYLKIDQVFIPLFNFDPTTQSKLNGLQQQVAATRIALQQQQTNMALARANEILAKSYNSTQGQGVLEHECLTILADVVQAGNQLPSGFSCFPGGAAGVAVQTH